MSRVAFFFCIVFLAGVNADTDEDDLEMVRELIQYHDECKKETGSDLTLLDIFTTEMDVQKACLFECATMKKIQEVMSSKVNKQKEMQKLIEMQERCEINDDCKDLEKAQEFSDCINDNDSPTKECAMGGLMAFCIIEVYPETEDLIRDSKS